MADGTSEQYMKASRGALKAGGQQSSQEAQELPAERKAYLLELQRLAIAAAKKRTAEAEGGSHQTKMNAAEQARLRAEIRRRKAQSVPAESKILGQTNMVEQGISGVNEGIANIAGFPVDAMAGAINMGVQGINKVAGTELQPIERPVGGSESLLGMMSPTISDTPPRTTAQRFGRRIGQELGASVVPGGVAMRGAQAPARVAAGTAASATGAGLGGQSAREIAPESDAADFIGSLIGGGLPSMAAHRMQAKPTPPSMAQLQGEVDAGYDAVRNSNATLSPQSSEALAASIENTFGTRAATKRLNPKAAIAADELSADLRQRPPTIAEVDEIRRWIGENVAGSKEASEARIGMNMKGAIDSHLDGLQPSDLHGTNRAGELVDTLKEARAKAARMHRAKVFEAKDTGAFEKARRRAATTGTGGNEVNAIRQNVRRILENPKLRKGYSDTELQAMRDIADGTKSQNAMRMLSRLAPSSGALPMTGMVGTAGAATATGNPLFLAPSLIGEGAKYIAERSTRQQVDSFGELLRNGKPLPKKEMSDTQRRIVSALLARQAAGQPMQGGTKQVVDALMVGR